MADIVHGKVADDSIPLQSYMSLRTVLRMDKELREEYERVKVKLAELYSESAVIYCNHKRPTIRKIFLTDGWTNAEVDEGMLGSSSLRCFCVWTPGNQCQESPRGLSFLGALATEG